MTSTAAEVEVKERSIIFSGPMVKAILEGRKTQTRRVIRVPGDALLIGYAKDSNCAYWRHPNGKQDYNQPRYGKIGSRLWVRESLRWTDWLVYDCDKSPVEAEIPSAARIGRNHLAAFLMPRWASRITLEITEIRVERLQEISEADVIAEGIRRHDASKVFSTGETGLCYATAREAFANGWDSINAKRGYSWESNPWVWAITFKKL